MLRGLVRAYLSQGGGGAGGGGDNAGSGEGDNPGGGDPNANAGGNANDAAFWKAEKQRSDREAKNLRDRLKQLEDADTARKQSEMTDLQKAQEAAKAANDALVVAQKDTQAARAEAAIARAAAKVGIPADLAIRLVDVEFDNGKPINVDEAVKKIAADYPQLVTGGGGNGESDTTPATTDTTAAPATGGSASNPPRSRGGGLTLQAVKSMTSAQLAALPEAEYKQVMDLLATQK